jgi:hypothetical protein
MRGADPPATNCNRPVIDPRDAQLLEALDGPDYIDDSIHGPDFVERNSLGRQSVHAAFGGSEQLKCANGAFPNPGRQIGLFYYGDQVPDVPSAVACTMIVMVELTVMVRLGVLV